MTSEIACFASDAGGANQMINIISSEYKNYQLFLDGPAKEIAEKMGLTYQDQRNFQIGKKYSNYIFASSIENTDQQKIFEYCFKFKLKTTGVLDHWINYSTRWNGVSPQELWVTDKFAYIEASKTFPTIDIIMKENYYFKRIENMCNFEVKKFSNKTALYLSERKFSELNDHSKCVCDDLMKILSGDIIEEIYVKPHPANQINECISRISNKFPEVSLYLESNSDLAAFIPKFELVYGGYTYALYIAKLLGLKTYVLNEFDGYWPGPKFDLL